MIKRTALNLPDMRPLALIAPLLLLACAGLAAGQARAQALDPEALEDLVAPIALYPDDVLGIILPASTFPLDIVQAARFLEDLETDPSLEPDESWDDAVVALLNYPEVLAMMNEDLDWTWALGEAVLTDQAAVLDAAQRFRSLAYEAGNLRSDERQTVAYADGGIRIRPADPEVVYIPVYEPREVIVYQPRPVYRYYPVAYPVYYYPYPVGYSFGIDYFWGVTSYFSIGWRSHHVHVHHHTHRLHPYYLNSYYAYRPYYWRSGVNITVVVDNYRNVWQPSPRRGVRPRTVTVENRSSTRSARSVTTESQPNLSTRTRTTASTATQRATSRQGTPRSNLARSQERSGSNLGGVSQRSTVRNEATRPDTSRSVQSPAVNSSQTRSIRTRDPAAAPGGSAAQPSAERSRTRLETAAPRATTRSSTTSLQRSQGTVRSNGSNTLRAAPAAAPRARTAAPQAAPRQSAPRQAAPRQAAPRQSAPRQPAARTRQR